MENLFKSEDKLKLSDVTSNKVVLGVETVLAN